jgi:mono/diheme cytochrome c family protein
MGIPRRAIWLATVLGAGGLMACGGGGAPESSQADTGAGETTAAAEITPAARSEAKQIYETRCAVCHGQTGRGDGPGAASLVPPPRNYHDAAWQDSVTDEEIENAIVYGGAAVGRSPAMVANPDLGSKPDVVAALREIVREFGDQP